MGPVFLLAGGGRTGSTLLQRLITSTRQVLMWGEHGGMLLPQLKNLFAQTYSWVENGNGYTQLRNFKADAHNAWIPNINPEPSYLHAGCRAFLEQGLGTAAREMGYPRWGFKEIRYGEEEVRILQGLFPRSSFIFLVRDPVSCLRSIKSTRWYERDFDSDPARFLNEWTRISDSLASIFPNCSRACFVRYEHAISNPDTTVNTIAQTINVPFAAFDLSVFDHPLRGQASPPTELSQADMEALHDQTFLNVAAKLGYQPLDKINKEQ